MNTCFNIFVFLLLNSGLFTQNDSLNFDSTNLKKKVCVIQKHPPFLDQNTNKPILRNQSASFGRKFLRGSGLVFGFETVVIGVLFATPESFSQWDRSKILDFKYHYKEAFTKAPVIDKDFWYINYIGHPYQGSFTYNSIRSQGAKVWQSSLYTLGHSFFWEYIIEGGAERPSVQDLIVTPIGGILLGELTHFATIKMSKNGFKWYEKNFVWILNPMFAINNGFRFAKPKSTPLH